MTAASVTAYLQAHDDWAAIADRAMSTATPGGALTPAALKVAEADPINDTPEVTEAIATTRQQITAMHDAAVEAGFPNGIDEARRWAERDVTLHTYPSQKNDRQKIWDAQAWAKAHDPLAHVTSEVDA